MAQKQEQAHYHYDKKPKKFGILSLLGWVFGVLTLLGGIVAFASSVFGAILLIIAGLIIIPKTNDLSTKHFNFSLSTPLRIIAYFVLIIIASVMIGTSQSSSDISPQTEVQTQKTPQTEAKPKKVYIEKTYDSLWTIFEPDSKFTDLKKEKTFNEEYKGKYVTWTGRVKDVDVSILDNLKLSVEHRNKGNFDLDGGDITVYMKKNEYDKLAELNKGDEVTYSAKFKSFIELMGVTFYMEDGELVT